MKQETKCIFLDGPIDGQMVSVPNYYHEWRVAILNPIKTFLSAREPTMFDMMQRAYVEHCYERTTSKTFLYKGEVD